MDLRTEETPTRSESITEAPVGVFDSGIGGVSVLRELRRLLPAERFVYYADSAHCPYGGRPAAEIESRAVAISSELTAFGCKLIVVACNTATIAAVASLRARFSVPFVGMEPAVKPACAMSRSGVVAVLATGPALAGEKFLRLVASHSADVRVMTQPCPGLVEAVEAGELAGSATESRLRQYIDPVLAQGADVIVLGCTHYPFLRPAIERIVPSGVRVIDAGVAVAEQTRRVLRERRLLSRRVGNLRSEVCWLGSGDSDLLRAKATALLQASD